MNAPCGCQSCRKGWRALISRKLGRCPRCLRWSALGALFGWSAVAVVALVWPYPVLVAFALLVATSFNLLFISHVVAFGVRSGRWEVVRVATDGDTTTIGVRRRAVLTMVLKSGAAVVGAVAFARLPQPAIAQAPPCGNGACQPPTFSRELGKWICQSVPGRLGCGSQGSTCGCVLVEHYTLFNPRRDRFEVGRRECRCVQVATGQDEFDCQGDCGEAVIRVLATGAEDVRCPDPGTCRGRGRVDCRCHPNSGRDAAQRITLAGCTCSRRRP